MPESLWQAVQKETEKQKVKTQPESASKPVQSLKARKSTPLPHSKGAGDKEVRRKEGTSPRPKVRPSVPKSERPKERLIERRPYDFYKDQVLWLKETKLEIEKKYGKRVPANAMVQLALDLLIEDYKRNKGRSKLVSELVSNGA